MLGLHRALGVAATLMLLSPVIGAESATADGSRPFALYGSTTFTHQVMEPYQGVIEAASGHKLSVVPSKSSRGLLGLFQQSADFAMISGPLENEIKDLKADNPELPFDRLRIFNIATTRMAFAVNRDNPVRNVSDDTMRLILLGAIVNWRDIGGRDLPISVVMVRAGGGVQSSIESAFLHGKSISNGKPILVQASSEVIKITELLPEALGLSQMSMVANANVAELKTEHPVEQHLDLVTLGDPTPEMLKVIEAARDVMSKAATETVGALPPAPAAALSETAGIQP